MQKLFLIISLLLLNSFSLYARTKHKAQPLESIAKPTKLVTALTTQNAASEKIQKKAPSKRNVKITNNIQPEMLVYEHWTGKKIPEPFAIVVDGKELEPGKTITATGVLPHLEVQRMEGVGGIAFNGRIQLTGDSVTVA